MAIIRRTINNNNALVKKVIYQDLRNIFIDKSNNRSDIETLTNEDAVAQSILNLLMTTPGERLFQSEVGSGIYKILFENITPQTTTALLQLIKSTLNNHEPRAKVLGVDVNPNEDENAYFITIIFSVINRTEPITLNFILNRVR